MDKKLQRLLDNALDLDQVAPEPAGVPGRSTLTSRLTPAPQVVFRVSDPETARALGASLRGRDDNGVAAGAEEAVARAGGSGGGAPLRADLQDRFEASLGADLSGVRVHTGPASAEASHAVGARAYTVGNDIHFAGGQYQPDDPFGVHLLAHEVAHTVQQSGGTVSRQHKLEVSAPVDGAELEADRAADAMVAGQAFAIAGASGLARKVHRDKNPDAADAKDADAKKDEKVSTRWYLDFEDKPAGGGTKSKVPSRDTKDALYATLKIFPADATSAEKIEGVNAANHGQVFLKSLEHPKDKGGKLSAEIKYGSKPTAKITVNISEAGSAKDDSKLKGELQKQVDAKVQSMMSDATFDQGDPATIKAKVQAEAEKIVAAGSGGKADHFTVTTQYNEHAGASGHSLKTIDYGAIAKEASCYAKVTVPSEKLTGQAGGSAEEHKEDAKEEKTADASKESEEKTKLKEKEKKTVESIKTQVSTALKSAWSKAKKQHTQGKTSISASAEEQIGGELAGKLSASAALKDFELPLPGKLGKIAKYLLGVKADIGASGEISGKVNGNLKFNQGVTHEHLDELTTEVVNSWDSTVNTSIESYSSTEVMTKVSEMVKTYYEEQHSHEVKNNTSAGKKKTSTWSTTTINFKVGDPILTLSITQ